MNLHTKGQTLSRGHFLAQVFLEYRKHGGFDISRQQFAENLAGKLENKEFVADIGPLLADGFDWEFERMAALVNDLLINKLPD